LAQAVLARDFHSATYFAIESSLIERWFRVRAYT